MRFGARLGTDGWALEDLAKWVTQLAGHAGAAGEALTTFAAGVALATGWADGFLAGSYEDGCTDPLTGLATPAGLALRLRQVYDQCAALGLDPRVAYALLVISVELPARSPLVRDAARVMLADRVAATFATGETACAAGDVICVLPPRTRRPPRPSRASGSNPRTSRCSPARPPPPGTRTRPAVPNS